MSAQFFLQVKLNFIEKHLLLIMQSLNVSPEYFSTIICVPFDYIIIIQLICISVFSWIWYLSLLKEVYLGECCAVPDTRT